MSFLNIEDTFQREKHIKEYLATVKRIKNRNLHERAQNFANHEMLEESFEPVVHATAASTEAITNKKSALLHHSLLSSTQNCQKLNIHLNLEQSPFDRLLPASKSFFRSFHCNA